MTSGTAPHGRPGMTTAPRAHGLLERYGPWAVVTGASSGLGLAAAQQLAAHGFGLVLVARREQVLSDVASRLPHAGPSDVRVVAADLGTPGGVARLLAATEDLDVGVVVHAAGYGTSGPFADADLARELDMLAVNCAATTALSLGFGQRLLERGRGGIVLFGSLVGAQGTPWAAHYAATKAYVQTLGEGLGYEWRPRGVDVLVALPGPVSTGFADAAGMRMDKTDTPGPVVEDILRALGRRPTVTPGRNGLFLTRALAGLPRRYRVRVMARVMQQMTGTPGMGR